MKQCAVCGIGNPTKATYRVDYRGEDSLYFCDDHILIAGVDAIKGIHKLDDNALEIKCAKRVM